MIRSTEYSFKTPLSYSQMRTLLDERHPGQWSEGDSSRYGDYLASEIRFTSKENGVIRIYRTKGFYLKLRLFCEDRSRHATAYWDRLNTYVMNEVAPAIQASELQPSSEID